jgi:hypothetical protein
MDVKSNGFDAQCAQCTVNQTENGVGGNLALNNGELLLNNSLFV